MLCDPYNGIFSLLTRHAIVTIVIHLSIAVGRSASSLYNQGHFPVSVHWIFQQSQWCSAYHKLRKIL